MAVCSNQIAVRYDCLSVTLEQVFLPTLILSCHHHAGWG